MTGQSGHRMVTELIGAWALDACSPAEARLVEAHLGGCASCAGEARALRETAGSLLTAPPAGLGARLRTAMPVRRRPVLRTPMYGKPYAAQISALDLLLTGLRAGDWERIAAYEEMSVHDLLAHLIAVDGMVAGALGLPVSPPVRPEAGAAERTVAVLAVEQVRPVEQTLRTWREQAEAVCAALPHQPDAVMVTLGRPMPVADALLARAFETWIHGEDIAGATGGPVVTPLAEHLHPMADLAVRLLPSVTGRLMPGAGGRLLRLHLTGGGGGSWVVPLSHAPRSGAGVSADITAGVSADTTGDISADITLDVVEFCRLVGDRRDPARLPVEVSGDAALAREWLAAVPALAPYP